MLVHPDHLSYSNQHVWVEAKEDVAVIGMTDDFQHVIPSIESLELPLIGDELEMGIDCIHFHLANDLFHVASPLTGRVTEVNDTVLENPERIFLSPYETGWLFKMEIDEPDEVEMLMSSEEYSVFLEETEE